MPDKKQSGKKHTLPKTTDTKVKIKSIMLDKLEKKVSVG